MANPQKYQGPLFLKKGFLKLSKALSVTMIINNEEMKMEKSHICYGLCNSSLFGSLHRIFEKLHPLPNFSNILFTLLKKWEGGG